MGRFVSFAIFAAMIFCLFGEAAPTTVDVELGAPMELTAGAISPE